MTHQSQNDGEETSKQASKQEARSSVFRPFRPRIQRCPLEHRVWPMGQRCGMDGIVTCARETSSAGLVPPPLGDHQEPKPSAMLAGLR